MEKVTSQKWKFLWEKWWQIHKNDELQLMLQNVRAHSELHVQNNGRYELTARMVYVHPVCSSASFCFVFKE